MEVDLLIYIIKFLYQSFLLPPGIFILIFLVCCYRLRKQKNKFAGILIIITFLFYFFTTPILSNSIIRSLENKYTLPKAINGDVIVMLSGGATLDTPNIGRNGHLSGYAANRLITCVELYKKLDIPILISGGQVFENSGREADVAKNILINMGIPEDKILVEDQSLNTTQNAKFTKVILDNHNFKNPILVTSAFHMERSVVQFKKFRINVLPFPTDYQTNVNVKYTLNDFIPSGDSIQKISVAVKEYIGILASKWY